MLKNYFRIAWANVQKHKVYAAINVSGLAVSIAACLLIFVVVKYELSFDRFQKNYGSIYRIVTEVKHTAGSEERNPGIPYPAYDVIKAELPQFKKVVALNANSGMQVTVLGSNANSDVAMSKKFIEPGNVVFTMPEYFDVFNADFLQGSPKVLLSPENVIIDTTTAKKYFGSWQTAVGQFVKLDNAILLKVAGIIKDAPENSDFPIRFFLSYEVFKKHPDNYGYSNDWGSLSSNHQVYAVLPANMNAASVQAQLNAAIKKHNGNDVTNRRYEILQPLKNMHFDYRYETLGDHTSSKTILLTLAFIGMLIIMMASINFINLSTAQAVGRSKEVSIRKVLGSTRGQLITQVMSETFLIVLTALLIAIVIAKIALPYLKNVASVPADFSLFSMGSVIFLFAVLIVVTILSGFYPALVVSGFKPALALKSKINSANIGGLSLRRVLVVTQFAISQALIIGTIVAISQMNAVRNADLGFDKEAVLITTLPSVKESKTRMTSLKQQLLQNPNITSISLNSDEASSSNNWASNFAFNGKDDEDYPVYHKYGDEDYLKTFGLQLAAGRNFEASDTIKELMINETLVKKLGVNDPQKIIGKTLRIGGGRWVPIVGVVKDFKTNSLKVDVKPLTIAPRKDFYFTMAVKMHTANIAATAAAVQKAWEKTYPEFAYDSHFADETIEQFYKQDNQLSLLYKLFAGIAVFISCLGLYGLVSFMAVQKTKEVGVRRVLGASISNVVVMFSKEFTILIVIAFAIAAPVAWFFMHNWLQNFAYKINIGIGIFLLAIVVSLIIAWITVGYRAVKAATANPVKSLRTE